MEDWEEGGRGEQCGWMKAKENNLDGNGIRKFIMTRRKKKNG